MLSLIDRILDFSLHLPMRLLDAMSNIGRKPQETKDAIIQVIIAIILIALFIAWYVLL